MAKHMVICKYCNEKFDTNSEPFVIAGSRRYAHKTCAEKFNAAIPQEEKDYQALEQYIKCLFNEKTLSAKIRKQIKDFREMYGYTYSGIQKTLYWWYGIKGHSLELAKEGIGIVPYIYDEAEKYYYTLYLAKMVNDNVKEYKKQIKEVEIASPRVRTAPIKLFKIEENE